MKGFILLTLLFCTVLSLSSDVTSIGTITLNLISNPVDILTVEDKFSQTQKICAIVTFEKLPLFVKVENVYLCVGYNESYSVAYDGLTRYGCLEQPYSIQLYGDPKNTPTVVLPNDYNMTVIDDTSNNTYIYDTYGYVPSADKSSSENTYLIGCFRAAETISPKKAVHYPVGEQFVQFDITFTVATTDTIHTDNTTHSVNETVIDLVVTSKETRRQSFVKGFTVVEGLNNNIGTHWEGDRDRDEEGRGIAALVFGIIIAVIAVSICIALAYYIYRSETRVRSRHTHYDDEVAMLSERRMDAVNSIIDKY